MGATPPVSHTERSWRPVQQSPYTLALARTLKQPVSSFCSTCITPIRGRSREAIHPESVAALDFGDLADAVHVYTRETVNRFVGNGGT